MTSGVFFQRLPSAATPLAFVEEAGEQPDGGAEFGGHQLGVGQGTYESGRGEQEAPRAQLPCLARAVGGAIQELAGELVPREPPVADELAQGVLGADAEQVVQLFAEMTRLRLADERLGGGDEGAGAGEPNLAERPQSSFVEVDEFVEGVVAAAMGVAGAGGQVLELAKCGAPGAGAEGGHHLGQRGDGLLAEQGDDRVCGEFGWSHYGTITVDEFRNSAIKMARTPPETACFPQTSCSTGDSPAKPFYSVTTDDKMKLFLRGPLRDRRRYPKLASHVQEGA